VLRAGSVKEDAGFWRGGTWLAQPCPREEESVMRYEGTRDDYRYANWIWKRATPHRKGG